MKKLLTLLAAMIVAIALSVPVMASQSKDTTGKSETTTSAPNKKAHKAHAAKKGAKKGKKEGQEGAASGKSSK